MNKWVGGKSPDAYQGPQNRIFLKRPALGVGDSEKDFGRAIANNRQIERQASGPLSNRNTVVHHYFRCHSLEHEIGLRKQELANQTSENATLRVEREASHERENSLSRTIERLGAEISTQESRLKSLQDEIQVSTEERKREHDR